MTRIEERTLFLGELVKIRRGTKEVENFVRKQGGLRHAKNDEVSMEESVNIEERERGIVVGAMVNKLNDNISKGGNVKKELISTKRRLMWRLKTDDVRRKFDNNLRERIYKS